MRTEKNLLQISNKPNLTKGQKQLYLLVSIKLDLGTPITFEEARKIWVNLVCREVRNGIPHYYNLYLNRLEEDGEVKFKGGYEPMNDYMIASRTILWLTSNIGALVLKGYLKAIPTIEIYNLTRLNKLK